MWGVLSNSFISWQTEKLSIMLSKIMYGCGQNLENKTFLIHLYVFKEDFILKMLCAFFHYF